MKLPKFTCDTSVDDAKEVLIRLGLDSIFSDHADLDRMFSMKASKLGVELDKLDKLDKLEHKTKITVDEIGAEARAASFASARFLKAQPEPIHVNVDHPFLFIIRHNKSGLPFFIGRVNKL